MEHNVLIPDHLIPFSFSSWYPRFAHCALKGVVIPLPPEFLAWLSEDGLLMPLECDEGEDSVEWSDEEIGEGGDGDGDGDKAEQDDGKSISTLIYFTGLVLSCSPLLYSTTLQALFVHLFHPSPLSYSPTSLAYRR